VSRPFFLLISLIALGGCAKPKFEFRGYSDLSSCSEIIDAELAGGANFDGGYESSDLEDPGYITALRGRIFEEPVRIEVKCDFRGFISSIHYISEASDPEATRAVFLRFAAELVSEYGEPTQIVTDEGLSLRFLCHNPSPILLEEWRLMPENEDDEPMHEVYLAVIPLAADCLDAHAA